MTRVLQCSTCLAKFNVDESVAGKTVACSKCDATFTAQMFPFANEEMLPNPEHQPVELEKPNLPPSPAPPPKKKGRSWFGKLKLAYLICVFPFVLMVSIGPIFLQDGKVQARDLLLRYITLIPKERAEDLSNKFKSFLPTKPTGPTTPQLPEVSDALREAIYQDKVKQANDLRAQGKPLLDAWTESGLIVDMNVISGDVLIDPLAWRNSGQTQIELVKKIGSQVQAKANMRITVTLHCSESGQRLGILHPGGEISVFDQSKTPAEKNRRGTQKQGKPAKDGRPFPAHISPRHSSTHNASPILLNNRLRPVHQCA